jgi:hypothetical protein
MTVAGLAPMGRTTSLILSTEGHQSPALDAMLDCFIRLFPIQRDQLPSWARAL